MQYNKKIIGYINKAIKLNNNNINKTLFDFIKKGEIELVKYIINKFNINVNKLDKKYSTTPLNVAIKHEKIDIIKYLVEEYNVNIYKKNKNGITAIYYSIKNDKLKIFKYLVIKYKDIFGNDFINKTNFLHFAVYFNKINIVKSLVEDYNFDINKKDDNLTVLDIALKHNFNEIIKYLKTRVN